MLKYHFMVVHCFFFSADLFRVPYFGTLFPSFTANKYDPNSNDINLFFGDSLRSWVNFMVGDDRPILIISSNIEYLSRWWCVKYILKIQKMVYELFTHHFRHVLTLIKNLRKKLVCEKFNDNFYKKKTDHEEKQSLELRYFINCLFSLWHFPNKRRKKSNDKHFLLAIFGQFYRTKFQIVLLFCLSQTQIFLMITFVGRFLEYATSYIFPSQLSYTFYKYMYIFMRV